MTYGNSVKGACFVCVVAAASSLLLGFKPTFAEEAKQPSAENEQRGAIVQSLDKVEKQEYDWGWIRWMMSSKINPDAEMTFGVVEIKPRQRNPLHGHPNCEEILYVVSGSCEHRIGDRIDHLKAGDMIRIPAGVPHMARTLDEPMRAIIVYSAGERGFELVEEN
jgi:quercetin dioxygenase-like cupin family protein